MGDIITDVTKFVLSAAHQSIEKLLAHFMLLCIATLKFMGNKTLQLLGANYATDIDQAQALQLIEPQTREAINNAASAIAWLAIIGVGSAGIVLSMTLIPPTLIATAGAMQGVAAAIEVAYPIVLTTLCTFLTIAAINVLGSITFYNQLKQANKPMMELSPPPLLETEDDGVDVAADLNADNAIPLTQGTSMIWSAFNTVTGYRTQRVAQNTEPSSADKPEHVPQRLGN